MKPLPSRWRVDVSTPAARRKAMITFLAMGVSMVVVGSLMIWRGMQASAVQEEVQAARAAVVIVDLAADGSLRIDGAAVGEEELGRRLDEAGRRRPRPRLIVDVARRDDRLVRLLAIAGRAGLDDTVVRQR